MVHLWLPVFMNTLPESYENLYTAWKNHADAKYDSQLALRAIPDYEPLTMQSRVKSSIIHFHLTVPTGLG